MSNRAALYLRSSRDRSDVSIDAQRRALHELAGARELVVADEYADAVESGKDEDRPAFQRLLRDLKDPTRGWEWVLALDTSRVARRRTIALIFESECAKRGVRIVYKNVPDTDPITEMLLKSILQAMDEWHSLTSKAKGLAGMAENVRQGWRAGGRAPRGYQLEYHSTGAVREGEAVMKSRLVPDEHAETVAAYLRLRADGVPRGQAVARLQLQWPASSVQSMDWQALTYAGHTVWNMHAEREGGQAVGGEKRRPRAQWLVARNTHPALISDAQAEAILAQMERAAHGRRLRASPLLLTGLLVASDGRAWHSDGCGYYRLGKGKKVLADSVERAVLAQLEADLSSDATVARLIEALRDDDDPVRPADIAGLERRIATLTTRIGRTVDLASRLDDPDPILRRVTDLESQRAELVERLADMRARIAQRETASTIQPEQVRALLRRLLAEITESAHERRDAARQALADVVERIELDPVSLAAHICYAVATGDSVASRRGAGLSPARWAGAQTTVPHRRRAA